jgi:hypothetical protein
MRGVHHAHARKNAAVRFIHHHAARYAYELELLFLVAGAAQNHTVKKAPSLVIGRRLYRSIQRAAIRSTIISLKYQRSLPLTFGV